MIRRSAVRGIEIPGPDGSTERGHTTTIKERALVDDTLVLLRDATDLTELVGVIEKFQRISNHKMNFSKSVLILLGKYSKMDVASSDEPEAGQLRAAMATCGLTAGKAHTLCGDTAVYVPKWHGVALASSTWRTRKKLPFLPNSGATFPPSYRIYIVRILRISR